MPAVKLSVVWSKAPSLRESERGKPLEQGIFEQFGFSWSQIDCHMQNKSSVNNEEPEDNGISDISRSQDSEENAPERTISCIFGGEQAALDHSYQTKLYRNLSRSRGKVKKPRPAVRTG